MPEKLKSHDSLGAQGRDQDLMVLLFTGELGLPRDVNRKSLKMYLFVKIAKYKHKGVPIHVNP